MAAPQAHDRPTVEKHLRTALHRVAAAQRLVDRQQAVLATLEAHGHATGTARKLLSQFEDLQALHVATRDRLIEELARLPTLG